MALGPGSIAFVGFNGDGSDNLAFVVLEEIASGTVITFTDDAWNGSQFVAGETTFTWTASSTVAAGTIIRLDSLSLGNGGATSSTGAISFTESANLGVGNNDEAIFAYVGSAASPTFLAAVANGHFSAGAGVLSGTGLTLGLNAIDLGNLDDDLDIASFIGSRDNQATLADYLPIGLERLGYETVGVTDPLEALAAFEENPAAWDTVITDQIMPQMSGVELVRKLKSVRPAIKVVLCTGYDEDADNEDLGADWIDALVLKPTDAANIASKLRQLIDARVGASA